MDFSHINQADHQYLAIVREILDSDKKFKPTRTQFKAKKVFGKLMSFDLSNGFIPILTTKKVYWKSAIKELLWIYVLGSNKVSEVGSHIWDEWMLPDGTIGKAYGYQARHLTNHYGNPIDQVEQLLFKLKNNPTDRGMIINLWNVEDLPYMALRPCAFMTMWDIDNGYLNCTLVQRSADVPTGLPFNMFQYAVLVHMFAHVTGLRPGKFNHYINNAHIYENQVEPIKTQLTRTPFESPTLWIDPSVTNFNDFRIEHFKLINYKHHPHINMGEIAV